MKKYNWRNAVISEHDTNRAKVVIKTKEQNWVDSNEKKCLMISIHSQFHAGSDGMLKMQALLSSLSAHSRSPLTVLFAETAHIFTHKLLHNDLYRKAHHAIMNDAYQLQNRYKLYLKNTNVVFSHTYIENDSIYSRAQALCRDLLLNDHIFQKYISDDAASSYTEDRKKTFPNNDLFLHRAILDIIEQCTTLIVLAEKGYRFCFYPGEANSASHYLLKNILDSDKTIEWIKTFITIEKRYEVLYDL